MRDALKPAHPRIFWPTIFMLLAAGLAAIGICTLLYLREAGQIEQGLRLRETLRIETQTRLFARDLQSVASDLRMLTDTDGLRAFLGSGQQADLDRAIRRAIFMSRLQTDYDQIRYLDESGQEIFRVDWNGTLVPRNRLQSKADRQYFQIAAALEQGQIFIATFELNREDTRMEETSKPTIRFATPVFDSYGHRRGVCVINYLGANMIARLEQAAPLFGHRLRVLNAQGYWIRGVHPSREWGFLFPDRAGMTMARTDPELWKRIRESDGQAMTENGLFTWARVMPRDIATRDTEEAVAADEFLVIASEVSPVEWEAQFAGLKQTFVIVSSVLLLLLATSGWFFCSRWQARQERDRFFNLARDLLCLAGFDGYFRSLNPAWETVLGISRVELLSKPFIEFVHPDDRAKTIEEMERMARGDEVAHFENRYRTKDGSYRWLSWNARSSVPQRLIYAAARDVTEEKLVNEQIARLNADLGRRAAQLEEANNELEAFSYSVSHDLRAPLRHIDGFVMRLRRLAEEALDEKGKHYLDIISDSARQMGKLIDDLLVFSRMARSELRQTMVDLEKMVKQIIEQVQQEAPQRPIRWENGNLPEVRADASMLRQVMVNLIENAVKYTRTRDQAEIEIGSTETPSEVVIFVRDNGVGFEMEYAHKLFGVFQRLHRSEEFEGTGIGLANVRRIVHRHGGRTWAEGKVNGGATFYFSLPKQKGTS